MSDVDSQDYDGQFSSGPSDLQHDRVPLNLNGPIFRIGSRRNNLGDLAG